MDDSLLRKTGRWIYGSRYQRDPLSPPFHVNFVRGLRVLQISGVASASVHSPKTLGWLPGQQRSGVNPADFAGHPTTVANLREYSFA